MKRQAAAVDVRLDETALRVHYRNEAHLRSGIARVADAYGWFVQEEVVVPGWGRIDLVLRYDPAVRPFLVELKLAVEKPSDVRKGYQQVDGYGRWWAKEHNEPNLPILSAVKGSADLIASIGDAYPSVAYRSCTNLINGLRTWNATPGRLARARQRLTERQHDLDLNQAAYQWLAADIQAADESAAEKAKAVLAKARAVTAPSVDPDAES